MNFRLSAGAQDDAISIFEQSVLLFGIEQAWQYHRGLFKSFEFLADFPRAARERFELNPPARVFRYKSHLIIYVIDDSGIFVTRIRHGHEDWASGD